MSTKKSALTLKLEKAAANCLEIKFTNTASDESNSEIKELLVKRSEAAKLYLETRELIHLSTYEHYNQLLRLTIGL